MCWLTEKRVVVFFLLFVCAGEAVPLRELVKEEWEGDWEMGQEGREEEEEEGQVRARRQTVKV